MDSLLILLKILRIVKKNYQRSNEKGEKHDLSGDGLRNDKNQNY
jgi:hypothetical protein